MNRLIIQIPVLIHIVLFIEGLAIPDNWFQMLCMKNKDW